MPFASRILRRVRSILPRSPERFLRTVSGVIHVGANTGQERRVYDDFGLRVLWIEPIPEVFQTLQRNLQAFSRQRALQYLVTDRDNAQYTFNLASNGGASSSILEFGMHKDIRPQVEFQRTLTLQSTTLTTLVEKERIDLTHYQALVIDTQGSELLVLKGADAILGGFEFVKTEVPDFESYQGCCQLQDMQQFFEPRGFVEFSRHEFAARAQGGSYYDIVYRRGAKQ